MEVCIAHKMPYGTAFCVDREVHQPELTFANLFPHQHASYFSLFSFEHVPAHRSADVTRQKELH
jgi:hypothetical protein